jgi:hypothetical protein
MVMTDSQRPKMVGWREWLTLPDLSIRDIEAKIDTGTKTSVLHVSFIEPVRDQGRLLVRFGICPLPERTDLRVVGFAPVKDQRSVTDFDGDDNVYFIIKTSIYLGGVHRSIELILVTQEALKYKMVLGRSALQDLDLRVDPSDSYLLGKRAAV